MDPNSNPTLAPNPHPEPAENDIRAAASRDYFKLQGYRGDQFLGWLGSHYSSNFKPYGRTLLTVVGSDPNTPAGDDFYWYDYDGERFLYNYSIGGYLARLEEVVSWWSGWSSATRSALGGEGQLEVTNFRNSGRTIELCLRRPPFTDPEGRTINVTSAYWVWDHVRPQERVRWIERR